MRRLALRPGAVRRFRSPLTPLGWGVLFSFAAWVFLAAFLWG